MQERPKLSSEISLVEIKAAIGITVLVGLMYSKRESLNQL